MTVAELIALLQDCDPALPVRLHAYDVDGERDNDDEDAWHEGAVATVCVYDGAVNLITPGD
jgi:hypothetical protein